MSLLPSGSDASPPDDAGPRVVGVDSDDADEVLSALSSGTARELLAAVHEDPAPPSKLADRVDTSLQNAQYHLENLEEAGAIEVVDTAYSAKGREMDVYAPSDQPLVIFAGEDSEGSTLRTALKRFLGTVGILAAGSLAVQTVVGEGSLLPTGGMGSSPPDGGASGGVAPSTVTATESATPPPRATPTESGGSISIQSTTTETAQQTPVAEVTDTAAKSATQTPTETATQTPTETVTQTITSAPETATEAVRTAGDALPPGLVFFAGGLLALAVVAGMWYLRQ